MPNPNNEYRPCSIMVSRKIQWLLQQYVKRLNSGITAEALKVPDSPDALACNIVSLWFADNAPDLLELWKERDAIDTKASLPKD